LDLDVFWTNACKMGETCRKAGISWRPHTKAIKVPAIAHRLLEAGADGITCAKLSEAEVMAAAGVRDILVANQVVGWGKVVRLANLQREAKVMVGLDSDHNAREINEAALTKGVVVPALVEVDTGQNRAGVDAGQATLDFLRCVANLPGLRICGLMTWEAHAAGINDVGEKIRTVKDALRRLVETADLCRKNGFSIEIVSCGGTATYWLSAFCPGITEIQAGGGVFSDVRYRTRYGVDHDYALTLMTTVTSRPHPTRVICDAGKKAMSADVALPLPLNLAGVKSIRLNAEHTIIELEGQHNSPRVGDRLEFVVGCADTTVHLHDSMYGIRNGAVESIWAIQGRGRLR
jgi:D-serine deaminase-like pyridoxal phosphate-dependent protein